MTVGMSCKSLEVQTPGNRQFSYPVGAFLQVILFFRLDKRDEPHRAQARAPRVLRGVRETHPWLALQDARTPGPLRTRAGDGWLRPAAQGEDRARPLTLIAIIVVISVMVASGS